VKSKRGKTAKAGKADLRVLESSCVASNLRKSAHIVSRIYAKEMASAPIRGPLFSLLASIHRCGPETITAIAQDLGLDRTTLTRNLEPLKRRGLIEIRKMGANRKEIRLLPKGETTLHKSLEFWRRAQTRVVSELGEARWNRMRNDLRAVMALDTRQ
jgi:DNA-binding MarR family transcriptional regulator